MPKKISIEDKRGWLKKYDDGMSVAAIARDGKRDVRTIRKGIEEARREQDIRLARVDMVKDALRKHQDSLEGELRRILKDLDHPPADFTPLSWYQGDNSIFTAAKSMDKKEETNKSIKVGRKPATQAISVRNLLRQHLRDDKLWKWHSNWEKALATHLTARKELQLGLVDILEKETGYKMIDYRGSFTPPFLCSYTLGPLLYQLAIDFAFSSYQSKNIEDDIIIDTGSGTIKYQNSIMAEVLGNEEVTRANILNAYRKIIASDELKTVTISFGKLQEHAARVRQAAEEILLLGLITGQCSICKRLGL